MMRFARPAIILLGLLALWELLVRLTEAPPYILPGPARVAVAWLDNYEQILRDAGVTGAEILLGLSLGVVLGGGAAIVIGHFRGMRRWLLPVLVVSQAIPVFTLAPLLVLWIGYGMASKVAMATLIIFFPVTASFLDGLRRTEPGWLDLASTKTQGHSRGRWAQLRHIRIPAALPALASGIRVATAVAPIGAVVGEWVGSSAGLGHLMLLKNARLQIDVSFAALFTLAVLAVGLYYGVDALLRRLVPWQHENLGDEDEGSR